MNKIPEIELVYRFDGEIYDTEEEALEAKKDWMISNKRSVPEMYAYRDYRDDFGRVNSFSGICSVMIVNLRDEDDIDIFMSVNDAEDCSYNGIDEDSEPGWYYYNEKEERFVKVDSKEEAFEAFRENKGD